MNFDAVRSNSSVIHAFPFNSEKKRGGVAVKLVMGLHIILIMIISVDWIFFYLSRRSLSLKVKGSNFFVAISG